VRSGLLRIAPAAVAVLLAFGATSCHSGPTSLAGQLQAWAGNAGYSGLVAQIAADLKNLHNGYTERRLLPLRTACEGFSSDVGALYTQLPTPDRRITNELASSLTSFFSAAVDCYKASSFSSVEFQRYQTVLRAATLTYEDALARLASYGVH